MPARSVKKVKLSDLGEFGLIERIKKQAGSFPSGIKGIGDDTAVVPLSSTKHLLLTTDMLLEGVHFTLKMPAAAIGHKAIASSISDIAAMGGVPKYAVVSLGVPASVSWPVVSKIYQGMQRTAKKFGVGIVGGDTVKSKKIIINVALTGEVKKSEVIYRSGAHVGDQVFVTGPLGKSLLSGWHLCFNPRAIEAQYLVKKYKPTAMIDISDGVIADLGHILSESRVGAVIDEDLIPKRRGAQLKEALYDGEDFELLFTLPFL
jgi:thiamine-monophosphate kinase